MRPKTRRQAQAVLARATWLTEQALAAVNDLQIAPIGRGLAMPGVTAVDLWKSLDSAQALLRSAAERLSNTELLDEELHADNKESGYFSFVPEDEG